MNAAPVNTAPWVVIKFGGTSVSRRERGVMIRRIAAAHRARGRRVLIVVSALSGITDQLKAIAEARADEARCREVQQAIVERHASMRAELDLDACARVAERLDDLGRLIADPRRS